MSETRAYQINTQTSLVTEECCSCGIVFAMPQSMHNRMRETGGNFYCPNGHGQHYSMPETQRLKNALDEQRRAATRMAERAAQAERALAAANARTAAGVCPCCNRTFKQLARHMKTKHGEDSKK